MQAQGILLPSKMPIHPPLHTQALGTSDCDEEKGLDFLAVVLNWWSRGRVKNVKQRAKTTTIVRSQNTSCTVYIYVTASLSHKSVEHNFISLRIFDIDRKLQSFG
jgi:hypothetical protein